MKRSVKILSKDKLNQSENARTVYLNEVETRKKNMNKTTKSVFRNVHELWKQLRTQ